MTDYRSWERYDVEREEVEADARLAMEDHLTAFTPEVLKTTKDALAAAEAALVKTFDALKSKLAVASLAGKGGMRNRRRGQVQGQGAVGEAADPRIGAATAVVDRLRQGLAALHAAYAALPTGMALPRAGEAAGACTSLYRQALAIADMCQAAVDTVVAAAPPLPPPPLGDDDYCCSDPNCRSQAADTAGITDMAFCGVCDPAVAGATAGGIGRRPLEEFPRVFASPDIGSAGDAEGPTSDAEGPTSDAEEAWVVAVKATAATVQEPVDRVLLQVSLFTRVKLHVPSRRIALTHPLATSGDR